MATGNWRKLWLGAAVVVARPCISFAMEQTEADSLPSPSNSRHRRPSEESGALELIYMIISGFLDGAMVRAMDAMDCKAVVRRRVGSLHQVGDGSKLRASALDSSSTSADLITWVAWNCTYPSLMPQCHCCSLACLGPCTTSHCGSCCCRQS